MFRVKKNDISGYALPATIVFMMVLFILGIAILTVSIAETNLSVRDKKRIQAFYLARSGVEATTAWVLDPANNATSIIGQSSNPAQLATGVDGEFTVEVIGDINDPEFVIKSTGTVDGVSAQAARLIRTGSDNDDPVFTHTLFGETSIYLTGSTQVVGDVATPYSGGFGQSPGQDRLDGDDDSPYERTFPPIAFPTAGDYQPTLTLNNNQEVTLGFNGVTNRTRIYNTLTYGNGSVLTVNTGSTGDGDVSIVVDNLSGGNSSTYLKITGDNRLRLFVRNSIAIDSNYNASPPLSGNNPSNRINGDPAQLILLAGPDVSSFHLNSNATFNGFIYAPGVTITTNGTPDFRGAIIGNIINLSGDFNVDGYTFDPGDITFEDFPVIMLSEGPWIKP